MNPLSLCSRTLLQFTKKKRKRSDSGSDLDLDATPPPSPKDDEATLDRRRSGRHTNKRKKYVDDVDLHLSDEENFQLPPEVALASTASNAAAASTTSTSDVLTTPKVDENGENSMNASNLGDASNPTPAVPEVPEEKSGPNYAFIVSSIARQAIQVGMSNKCFGLRFRIPWRKIP